VARVPPLRPFNSVISALSFVTVGSKGDQASLPAMHQGHGQERLVRSTYWTHKSLISQLWFSVQRLTLYRTTSAARRTLSVISCGTCNPLKCAVAGNFQKL
jgi:hypothetical protein